jgi:hypothetical protein
VLIVLKSGSLKLLEPSGSSQACNGIALPAGAYGWQPYHLHVLIVLKSGSLKLLEPSGSPQACNGIALNVSVDNTVVYFTSPWWWITIDRQLTELEEPEDNLKYSLPQVWRVLPWHWIQTYAVRSRHLAPDIQRHKQVHNEKRYWYSMSGYCAIHGSETVVMMFFFFWNSREFPVCLSKDTFHVIPADVSASWSLRRNIFSAQISLSSSSYTLHSIKT